MTQIFLIRHGEVDNPNNILYGRLPNFSLSKAGVAQARATAKYLKHQPLAAIFSSPLLRAIQTAKEIRSYHPKENIRISKLLHEIKTPYEGIQIDKLRKRNWDVYTGNSSEFEQPINIFHRLQKFLKKVRKDYPKKQVLAVTHGDPILFLTRWAKSQPIIPKINGKLDTASLLANYPKPASISIFTYQTGDINEVPEYQYVAVAKGSSKTPIYKFR